MRRREDHGAPYWTERDSGEAETYTLSWQTVSEPVIRGEVCHSGSGDVAAGQSSDAVVFEGEYYDPNTRNITETDTTDFTAPFNVACMSSLPAKMELSRRTAATQTSVYHTTIADDRQALARVWAAEYCLGKTFTKTGHKIKVRDRRGWLSSGLGWTRDETRNAEFNFEAVWDANGAVCLDTPRLAVSDPIVPIDPDIVTRIQAECGQLPNKCSEQKWFPRHWKQHGQFLTATVASE